MFHTLWCLAAQRKGMVINMTKKYSRIIAAIMLVIAIVFIFIALNNPQASFPWSNEITYILYGVYVCLMIVLFIAPFKRKK